MDVLIPIIIIVAIFLFALAVMFPSKDEHKHDTSADDQDTPTQPPSWTNNIDPPHDDY